MSFKSSLGPFKNKFAEDIFRQKYRHDGCLTWGELCNTLVDEVCGDYLSNGDKEQLKHFMQEMKFIPGGRYLYYAGRSKRYYNNCFRGTEQFLSYKGLINFKDNVGEYVSILSPVSNTWEIAKVEYFGKQVTNKITFQNIRGKSNKSWVVYATANHIWPLVSGETTDHLIVGDQVKAVSTALTDYGSQEGVTHGMVYADGNVHELKDSFAHQLRLCGLKRIHKSHFEEDYVITYPTFANGDPIVYIKSKYNLKELPRESDPIEYIIGFIRGWIALDGHNGLTRQIHSIHKEAIEFFIKYAPYCGFVVSGNIKYTDAPSNFGDRKPLYWVNFSSQFPGFKVVSIEKQEEEDVYCLVEPKHHQFYLANGIATSNCYLLKCLEDSREDWADLSWKAERCLTVGGGIGSDYSIYRARGSYLHGTGGTASGPISKMRMVNEIGREVIQGGSRRSAIYASLNYKHQDIQEFLHAKDWAKLKIAGTDKTYADVRKEDFNFPCPLDMTNISVNYDTSWIMNYWTKGELGEIFMANCRQAMMGGEPGFSFNFFEKEKETLRNA
jgi:hypothetical protein